jgi:hypothetical protein
VLLILFNFLLFIFLFHFIGHFLLRSHLSLHRLGLVLKSDLSSLKLRNICTLSFNLIVQLLTLLIMELILLIKLDLVGFLHSFKCLNLLHQLFLTGLKLLLEESNSVIALVSYIHQLIIETVDFHF